MEVVESSGGVARWRERGRGEGGEKEVGARDEIGTSAEFQALSSLSPVVPDPQVNSAACSNPNSRISIKENHQS